MTKGLQDSESASEPSNETSYRKRSMSLPRRIESVRGTELRVLQLNCWCLPQPWPIGSSDRKHRLKRISEALLEEPYDIVGFQEIWGEKDYLYLIDQLCEVYGYYHYFHSGFTGSGVCVFSRHPIVSSLTHRFSLNGFAHHIHRGDWFGGKVIGLTEIEVNDDLRVNFFSTHLHAEYDRKNDLYLPHRTAQAFEVSQFIRHTSRAADVIILTGDLNLEPDDLGFRIILAETRLHDAWRMSHEIPPDADDQESGSCRGVGRGSTCDRPDNSYTSRRLRNIDESKRIDYILFKNGRMNIHLEECELTLNKIPGEDINYSDHVGLRARFTIESGKRQISTNWEPHRPLLHEAIDIVASGQKRARRDRTIFLVSAALMVLLIIATCFLDAPYPYLVWPLALLRLLLTLIVTFCVWQGLIGLTLERKALKASKQSMQQLLNE